GCGRSHGVNGRWLSCWCWSSQQGLTARTAVLAPAARVCRRGPARPARYRHAQSLPSTRRDSPFVGELPGVRTSKEVPMFRRFGLLGTFGLFVLCLLVLAGVGLYLGWFSISTSGTEGNTPDIHVSLNKLKVKEDMKVVEKDVK